MFEHGRRGKTNASGSRPVVQDVGGSVSAKDNKFNMSTIHQRPIAITNRFMHVYPCWKLLEPTTAVFLLEFC